MKNKVLSYLLGWVFAVLLGFWWLWLSTVEAANPNCWGSCEDGIKLNTCFPIIWDCIKTGEGKTNAIQAFPTMIWSLTKLAMALILIVCFIAVIIAWIMWAWAWEDASKAKTAKTRLIRVAVTVLLLWFSWVILRLINPNFFG